MSKQPLVMLAVSAFALTACNPFAPGAKRGTTTVSLDLANATPGGVHPWQLHQGQWVR